MDDSRKMILFFVLIFLGMLLFQSYLTSNKKNIESEEVGEKVEEEKTITSEEEKLPELLAEKDGIQEEDSAETIKISTNGSVFIFQRRSH